MSGARRITIGKRTGTGDTATVHPPEVVLEETFPSEGPAGATMGVNLKVSEAVLWGTGTWDKVPFSVEVFSSVSLRCGQAKTAIQDAQDQAFAMALSGGRDHLVIALRKHMEDIPTKLFPELFSSEEA